MSKRSFLPHLCRIALSRLARSFASFPGLRHWGEALLLLAFVALIAVPLGMASGFLKFEAPNETVPGFLLFAAVAVAVPSLFEETIFRALLLPHPTENRTQRFRAASTAAAVPLFVLGHPLVGFFSPSTQELFYDPSFLALCAVFGFASSLSYLRSGSIWPCVAMHWGIVVAWKVWFGGWIFFLGPK